jgi:Flp pilus assembly protein TadB
MDVARAEAVVSLPRPPTAERLSPHEDVQRLPDGVPHMVIGLTALFSVALAAILIGLCFAGPSLGLIGAAVLIIVSLPSLVFWLNAKAENGRDHDHPSR